jgi:hypothetical protein
MNLSVDFDELLIRRACSNDGDTSDLENNNSIKNGSDTSNNKSDIDGSDDEEDQFSDNESTFE